MSPRADRRRAWALALALASAAAAPLACEPAEGDDGGDDPHLRPVDFTCAEADAGASDPYIDCVDSFLPADASFGHDRLPEALLGPPRGAGALGGSDVVSLGCGGEITLFFAAPAIVDGPGPDFIVFENAFALGDATFVEPARVLVSDDGERWREFPCDLAATPPRGCAGIAQVDANPEAAPTIDPLDPAVAGGDAFDLAEVGLERARWIRLVDVGEAYYGHAMWCAGEAGGFDLDAIAAVNHGP